MAAYRWHQTQDIVIYIVACRREAGDSIAWSCRITAARRRTVYAWGGAPELHFVNGPLLSRFWQPTAALLVRCGRGTSPTHIAAIGADPGAQTPPQPLGPGSRAGCPAGIVPRGEART